MFKDIDKLYFTDEEFDIFGKEHMMLNGQYQRDIRKQVRNKLLDLNESLLERIKTAKLDIHNHYNPKNVTSLTMPCEWNRGKVNWLGVRYGRSKRAMALLNYGLTYNEQEEIIGFQKYACLQVNVCYSGVEVGIYHAVSHDSVDREYLHSALEDTEKQLQIINAIKQLQGFGYKWSIATYGETEETTAEFDFDNNKAEDFVEWYQQNDKVGTHSSLLVHFPRYSKDINVDNIEDTCFDIIKQLYDFYRLVIWLPKEDNNER